MSRLAKYRKEAGLTQKKLAGMLDIDRTTVAKWEAGKAFPRIKMIPALAKALDINISELIAEYSKSQKGA